MKLTDALKQSFPNAYEWQRRKESRRIKRAAIIAGRQIGSTLTKKEFKEMYPDIPPFKRSTRGPGRPKKAPL